MTDQKYGPVRETTNPPAENAPPIDSTVNAVPLVAQKENQAPPSADSRELHYFTQKEQEAKQDLTATVTSFFGVEGASQQAIRAITETLQHWIFTKYKGYARSFNDEDLKYYDEVITGTLSVVNLITTAHEQVEVVKFYRMEVGRELLKKGGEL